MAETIVRNLIWTTIVSSTVIVMLLILKKTLFKNYTRSFHYYIWIVIIIRMLIPFRIPVNVERLNKNIPVAHSFMEYGQMEELESQNDNVEVYDGLSTDNGQREKSNFMYYINELKNVYIAHIIIFMWLGIAAIVAIYKSVSYMKMKSVILDLSEDITDKFRENIYSKDRNNIDYKNIYMVSCIYDKLKQELKINNNIKLLLSETASIPFGIGMLKKYIIIPKRRYEESEIRWILKHELIHYKSRDLIYKFFIMSVNTLYWFNPLVYVMVKEINNDCELSCDEKVLKNHNFDEKKEYALTLIKSLKHGNKNYLGINMSTCLGNKEVLKRRFDNMFTRKTKNGLLISGIFIIACAVSFCVVSNKTMKNTSADETQADESVISDNNDIEMYSFKSDRYKGYYLLIKDPIRIKVAYNDAEDKGQTLSEIAEENNAVAAINGGAFHVEYEDGEVSKMNPEGFVISDGRCTYDDNENSLKYETFAMTDDGKLITGKYSRESLEYMKAKEALSFGPSLIINGKMREMTGDGGWGIAPRTAIGQKDDGTIILLVIEGRSMESLGATLKETQEILYKLGAVNAVNLDGGKSSAMYYGGKIVNDAEERKISTAVIVK